MLSQPVERMVDLEERSATCIVIENIATCESKQYEMKFCQL